MTCVIQLIVKSIERLCFRVARTSLPDGFPFWGFTDPRIGDLSITDRRVAGHTPRRHGPGDWRCTCGRSLSGGSLGKGRAGARDAMRLHRLDLNHPEDSIEQISVSASLSGEPSQLLIHQ
jgi:hypothetical protein